MSVGCTALKQNRLSPTATPTRWPWGAFLLLPLLAGCTAPVSRPGGTIATPPAEVRAVETTGRTGNRVLGITQGSIRACTGYYDAPTTLRQVRTTDLACTGGVRGTATVGPDIIGGRSVQWKLDTGESGKVRL